MIDYDGKECYRMIDKIFLELRGQKKSFRAEDFVAIFESPGMGLGVCQAVLEQMEIEEKVECGPDPEGKIVGILYASKEAYIDDGR